MAEEEVGLRLALKNRREVTAGLDDVGDELDRVGDKTDRVNRESRAAARGMISLGKGGKVAGRAIVYGFGGAATAVVGAGIVLTRFSKDALAEAREAQKVSAVSRAEIKATGGVANVTMKSLSRLSGAISDKVGMDDELIQSGANLLLTFKNVRNEQGKGNKVFNQATQAAVDLSAAGFGSIESGSKMLGKALNDPLKGITALSRAGVTFSEQQQERIADFVEENDLLSAQKLILGEVRSQVGGVAAEQATWGDKAGVLWGNIQERFGTAILPMLDDVNRWFVQDGGPQLDRWVGKFEDHGIPAIERGIDVFRKKALPAIGDFIDDARPLAESIIPAIGTGLETSADAFKVIAPRAKQVFDAFNDLPDWAKTGIALSLGAGALAKRAGAFDRGSLIGSIASRAKPLPVWVVNGGLGGMPGTGGKPGTPIVGGSPGRGAGSRGLSIPKWAPFIPVGLDSAPGQQSLLDKILGRDPGRDPNAIGTEADWQKMIADRARASRETLERLLVRPLGRDIVDTTTLVGKLGATLGGLDSTRSRPRVAAEGLPDALAGGDRLIGLLGHLDRTTARPRVEPDLTYAESRLAAFQSKMNALDVATMTVGPSSSDTNWNHLRGPRPPRPPKNDDRDPAGRAAGVLTDDYYFDDLEPLPSTPLIIQLDGKVIAESTVEHIERKLARQ